MSQPNILFLLSDEHSFRFMGHREDGEPVDTPNFDSLAAHGTVFTDAYCQMPLCTPSRLCLLTGREVRQAGAWGNGAVLRPELPTMPRVLADAGYRTCLIGKMHLGGNQQFVGFHDRPYGDLTGQTGHQWEPLDQPIDKMRQRTRDAGVTEIPESLIQDEVVAQETIAYVRERAHAEPDRPWFVCASFSHPHFPLTAPRRHFERYWPEAVTDPRVPASGDAFDHPMSVGMRKGFRVAEISQSEMMKARAAYFACVSYLDEVIGDLLLRMDASGLLENTIVVYTTDHGEMAGEHGVWWKNGWYEACTHIPMVISTPQQRAGKRAAKVCSTPVALVDLFPTFCGFAGTEKPSNLAGRDLSQVVLAGADLENVPVYCDSLSPRWGEGTEFRMVRHHQFKYIAFRDAPPLMFDVVADPGEQTNLLLHNNPDDDMCRARDLMIRLVERSMDFEDAERERTVRDGDLRTIYSQKVSESTGNLYLMPSGLLVNAEDSLYHPTVIAQNASDAFGDGPTSQS